MNSPSNCVTRRSRTESGDPQNAWTSWKPESNRARCILPCSRSYVGTIRTNTVCATSELARLSPSIRLVFVHELRRAAPEPFSFAAYGDSAILDNRLEGFRSVQRTINASTAQFSLLLGDNIYDSGTHQEADARFDPALNPEATSWIANHVDYLAIGNHDFGSNGQASRDSFSMPTPVAGVNAFVAPGENEVPEFFSSFDYGDVHFVTFDSNSAELSRGETRDARIAAQADFLVENLVASKAKWKIVYMHHPMVGSVKLSLYPDTNYLEILLPRLVEAGADLIMSGDSHTYAWSYPIQGWNDVNADGEVADGEVRFDARSTHEFTKGEGPIHLISGAGGKNLRNDPFGQPYMAQTHSTHPSTLPIDYGFAHVHVTQQQLTVQYISAQTGAIFGDTNANGLRDEGEGNFAEFTIVDRNSDTDREYDFDRSGELDHLDLDLACAAIRAGDTDLRFDVTKDRRVDMNDFAALVASVFETGPGDANLDQTVDTQDLVIVFKAGTYEQPESAGWREGDWNCDGRFTSADLVKVFQHGLHV